MTMRCRRAFRCSRAACGGYEAAGAHDGHEPREGVAQDANLLALIESPGLIGHGNLDHRVTAAQQLAEQLEIEVEAVALQGEPPHTLGPEHFVHRRRIGQSRSEQQVEKGVKQHTTDIHQRSARTAAGEFSDLPAVGPHVPAAEYDGGAAFCDRPDQVRVIADVVFEVGVLNEQDVAGGCREAITDCMSLASGFVLEDQPDTRGALIRVLRHEFRDDLARAVGGVALDDDEFLRLLQRLRPHSLEKRRYRARLVVDGDDDRDLHG